MAVLLAAGTTALVVGAPPQLVWIAVLAAVALDGACARGWRTPDVAALELESSWRAEGDQELLVTGGTLGWTLQLTARRRQPSLLVTPLVPTACEVLGGEAWCGTPRLGRTVELVARWRPRQPGPLLLPGLLLRRASPLGLWQPAWLLAHPRSVTVVPDATTSQDPRLWRLLRQDSHSESRRGLRRLGQGTDFAELRGHRPSDPPSRVDWKATARRQELIVREFESPRDFRVSVLLDVSPDMTQDLLRTGGYGQAADLLARLSWLSVQTGLPLSLVGYDRRTERDLGHAGTPAGHRRLLTGLVALPRRVLVEQAVARADADELALRARRVWSAGWGRWRGAGDLEDFLQAWRADLGDAPGGERDAGDPGARRASTRDPGSGTGASELPDARELASFLADAAPWALTDLGQRCADCGQPRFADEPRCSACGAGDELSERAACLVGALAGHLRRPHGRELLLVLTTLQGGETAEPVARLLELAARGARSVHVAIPSVSVLADWRPTHPTSVPSSGAREPVLTDIERLAAVHAVQAFRHRLEAAGIHVHRLEDRDDLDAILVRLVETEVLAP